MTIRPMPIAALSAALLSLVVINGPAFAQQTTAPETQPSVEGQPPAAITDQKLEAFAVAYLQVDKVRQDYSARIGATTDAAAKQKLQNEANQQMIKAVESSPGMSLNDYKTVIAAAQTDPAVAKKLQEKLQNPAASQPSQ